MQLQCVPGRCSKPKYSGIGSGALMLHCCHAVDMPHVGGLGVYCSKSVTKNPLFHLLFLYLLTFHFLVSSNAQNEHLYLPHPLFSLMFTHPYLESYFLFFSSSFLISSYFSLSLESHSLRLLLLFLPVGYCSLISVVAVFYIINVHLMGKCTNTAIYERKKLKCRIWHTFQSEITADPI